MILFFKFENWEQMILQNDCADPLSKTKTKWFLIMISVNRFCSLVSFDRSSYGCLRPFQSVNICNLRDGPRTAQYVRGGGAIIATCDCLKCTVQCLFYFHSFVFQCDVTRIHSFLFIENCNDGPNVWSVRAELFNKTLTVLTSFTEMSVYREYYMTVSVCREYYMSVPVKVLYQSRLQVWN